MLSRRVCNFIGFLICALLLAVAYFYMEKHLYLNPCPLCYAQRFAVMLLGFFFLIATIFPGKSGKIHFVSTFFIVASSIFGASLSIRHLYLQNLPKDEVPACGPDVFGLFEQAPFLEAIMTSLSGTGDCAEIQWTFLGLSIPGWTLIAFIMLAVWGIINNLFRR